VSEVAPETQELVDAEVRRIVDGAYQEVRELLNENRAKLDSLAQALLQHETLDEPDAYAAAGIERPPEREREAERELAAAAMSSPQLGS
jgi:cell division protease FtsH